MTGYLIYHLDETKKNQGFIQKFCEEGKALGVTVLLVLFSEYREKPLPDFVLNRTREASVSFWYEKKGVTVFHGSFFTQMANNKKETFDYFSKNLPEKIRGKKWMPETVHLSPEKTDLFFAQAEKRNREYFICNYGQFFLAEGGCVIKSLNGHGGGEVFCLTLPQEASGWKEWEKPLDCLRGKECLLQERVKNGGRDLRVYVMKNQIYCAMLRRAKDGFYANISLGACAEKYLLSAEEKKVAGGFINALSNGTAGLFALDFFPLSDGTLLFNELEEMAGCRMLYTDTDRDVVKDYLRWILCFCRES